MGEKLFFHIKCAQKAFSEEISLNLNTSMLVPFLYIKQIMWQSGLWYVVVYEGHEADRE